MRCHHHRLLLLLAVAVAVWCRACSGQFAPLASAADDGRDLDAVKRMLQACRAPEQPSRLSSVCAHPGVLCACAALSSSPSTSSAACQHLEVVAVDLQGPQSSAFPGPGAQLLQAGTSLASILDLGSFASLFSLTLRNCNLR